ncbi:MAG: 4Fe-4S dicluster domain-containing protein [Roseobacter sp.]|jgi:ferredoxin
MTAERRESTVRGAKLIEDPLTLISALLDRGFRVIAPCEKDGVIEYAPIAEPAELPRGRTDDQQPGQYRLIDGDPHRWFDYVVGPGSWKAWLHPAKRQLWHVRRDGSALHFEESTKDWEATVLFGVRPCELAAIDRQRNVFQTGPHVDPDYGSRLSRSLVVVVQCARAAPTCFCASMETGPRAEAGFDLALTELGADADHRFLVESGSDAGSDILESLEGEVATNGDFASARQISETVAQSQKRQMPQGVATGLADRLDSPVWDEIASRCLSCANCTMACPTCFCSTVEDRSDLAGQHAERWLNWDSCFSVDFSYLHGGAVRQSPASRYRQWMTHKLSYWHDQFGESGCVGCGRCITWCPVGIDIVAEAAALLESPAE